MPSLDERSDGLLNDLFRCMAAGPFDENINKARALLDEFVREVQAEALEVAYQEVAGIGSLTTIGEKAFKGTALTRIENLRAAALREGTDGTT